MTDHWAQWVANQPVLVAVLMLANVVQAYVIGVLFRRAEKETEARIALTREVLTVTAAHTAAVASNTAAVERLTDALRSRR
jgi:hypothetical protein